MSMTTSNQSSQTSGTSVNKTFGDKYTKQMVPLSYAAAGYDPKAAKKEAKYRTKLAKLEHKFSLGKMSQEKYEKALEKLSAKQAVPSPVTPGQAGIESMTPYEFYPEKTYVEQDPYTLEAIAARAQMAKGNPMTGAAQGYISDTLAGKYLSEQNPYLARMAQEAASGVTSNYLTTVLPQLEARFSNAGGRGGAYQAMLNASNQGMADELAGMYANLYGGAYMQERDLMDRAAGRAPSAQAMGYYDVDELGRAGQQVEDFERTKLQDAMSRYQWDQNKGFNELARMTGANVNLPMAAGTGSTQYDMRTTGGGQEFFPSIPDKTPRNNMLVLSLSRKTRW